MLALVLDFGNSFSLDCNYILFLFFFQLPSLFDGVVTSDKNVNFMNSVN